MRSLSRLMLSAALVLALSLLCLSAQAGADLKGKVVTAQGEAIAGVKVRLYYCHDSSGYGSRWLSETKADEKGVFTITRPDFEMPVLLLRPTPVMRYYLVATQPGCAPGITEVMPREDASYTITLEPGRTITCTVLNQAGKSISDVNLFLQVAPSFGAAIGAGRRNPDGLADVVRETYRAKTDATGKCTLSDAPMSSIILRGVHNEQGVGFAQLPQGVKEATLILSGKVTSIRGTATYKDTGKPAEGMIVYAVPRLQRTDSWCVTGADGKFDLPTFVPGGRGMPGSLLLVMDAQSDPAYATSATGLARDGEDAKDLTVQLVRGQLVSGMALNPGTKEPPMAGAVIAATATQREGLACTTYRLSDAQGRYRFRVDADTVEVGAAFPPPGYVMIGGFGTRSVDVTGDVTDADVSINAVSEAILSLVVKDPDGKPAPGVQVTGGQLEMPVVSGRTDLDGQVRFGGLAEGKELKLYMLAQDRSAAAAVTVPLLTGRAEQQLAVQLQAAKTAKFVLQDADGQALPGFVLVHLFREGERPGVPVAQGRVDPDAPDKVVQITGLLPNVDYAVRGFAQGFRPADGGQWTMWHFEGKDQTPTLALRFQRQQAMPPAAVTLAQHTAEEFNRDLETLKGAVWSKPDPADPNLTWYAEKQGIAIADAGKKEVKRFKDLLGAQGIVVSGIAFAKNQVWIGTDKGLFAWNRKEMYWSLFAVGRLYADLPVKELSLEDNTLHVTVQEQGKNPRRFDYNIVTEKWEEIR